MRTAGLVVLVEVVDCRGCAAADFVGAAARKAGCDAVLCRGARCGGTRRSDRGVLADAEFDSEANHQPFGNAWEQKHYPAGAGVSERRYSQSDVPRLSEETVSAALQDRKHLLRRQTQTLLARTGRSLATQVRQACCSALPTTCTA